MRILLVCTGNTCRSPLAEVWLSKLQPEWSVRSAGLSAQMGQPASQHAATVAKENGLDLSAHRANPITTQLMEWADLVVCVTDEHRRALLRRFPAQAEKVEAFASPVADPYGADLRRYREASRQIHQSLLDWLTNHKRDLNTGR